MADITHLYGECYMGHLIELKTPKNNRYYFQNFSPGDNYIFDGVTYQWLPFQVTNFNEQLELNSESLEINVVNTEVIRNFFNVEGDIRKSLLILKTVFPDAPNAPLDVERTQISNYNLSKAMIQIACASPVLALNNRIPTEVFDPVRFPALPFVNKPAITQTGQRG